MQSVLKKRKTKKALLETAASESGYDMKEKTTVLEIDPTVSSRLSRKAETAIDRLIKRIAPVGSNYNVSFRTLAEEHRLGEEKI